MRLDEVLKLSGKKKSGGSGPEMFTFMNLRFYPDKIMTAIKDGKIKPKRTSMDTTPWAERMLGLKKGDTKYRPHTMMVSINYKHVDKIDETRLNEPGIIVDTKKIGNLVVDGNHRLARRFMDGNDEMEFYFVTEAQAKKVGGME